MSRAFVKEHDGDSPDDELPESPVSSGPNYVTPEGLADLQARLAAAQSDVVALRGADGKAGAKSALARARADVRRLQRRIDAAVLVKTDEVQDGEITLGMRATIEFPDGKRATFTIVGEDEADPVNGLVSWRSPLGEALVGKREGDVALWLRPAGNVEIKIVAASARI
jgi:transcription elongation GreA/GreB family factor